MKNVVLESVHKHLQTITAREKNELRL